ncbi:helix-turn-helix transcriptional regulator [bacterium]|nr:helix-turn-helix transcriptional regulator [bacterium]
MQKQDTATLNHQALAELLHSRGLKQYWVANRIGVVPLTVNRWLTGKVRRISLDNLDRLATLLQCPPEQLILRNEASASATQVEQTRAARMLVSPQSQDMFVKAGQLETYEHLIKAVMHPNLTISTLLEVYTVLTLVAGLKGDFSSSYDYAKLKLEYALRCGDADKELEARINMVSAQAALGRLAASHRGLLELYSAAESQGALRSMVLTRINLIATYRLLGQMPAALRCGLEALRLLDGLPAGNEDQLHWRLLAASYALFSVTTTALDCGEEELVRLLLDVQKPYIERFHTPIERLTMVATAMLLDLQAGLQVDQQSLDELCAGFLQANQFGIGGSILPALCLRASGRLEDAAKYLEAVQTGPGCEKYEACFVADEWLRLHRAMGNGRMAKKAAARARELKLGFGMLREAETDCAEFGQHYKVPAALVRQIAELAPQVTAQLLASSGPPAESRG